MVAPFSSNPGDRNSVRVSSRGIGVVVDADKHAWLHRPDKILPSHV